MGLGLSNESGASSTKAQFLIRGRPYRVLNIIGQGGEATVYRCKDANGRKCAVKVFYFSRFPPHQLSQRIASFNHEGHILKSLRGRSPHFINLIDFEYRPRENLGFIVMELGEGSLREELQGLPLDEARRRYYWKQIVAMLKALEDAQIVHADIKPDNLIVVDNSLKLTDFGLAFPLTSNRQGIRRADVRGTLDYMASEVFSHQTGFKSDIWSAGIILYEMTYGRPPYFQIFDRHQKVSAISSRLPIRFAPVNDFYLLDCIKRCLQFDPHRRPSPRQLLAHPYTRS